MLFESHKKALADQALKTLLRERSGMEAFLQSMSAFSLKKKNEVSYMYVCILPLHVSVDQNDHSGNICLFPWVDTTTSCILQKI